MKRESIELTSILTALTLAILAVRTPLHNNELEIGTIIFIILFLLRIIKIPQSFPAHILSAALFGFFSLFVVLSTGASSSPFFFLLYFLLFAVSLLLNPIVCLLTTVYLMIVLTTLLPEAQTLRTVLPVISLGFLSPFALYLGNEQKELFEKERLIVHLTDETRRFLKKTLKRQLQVLQDEITNNNTIAAQEDIKKTETLISLFESQIEHELQTQKHAD